MKLCDVMKDSKIKIHASISGHGILLITKAAIGVRDGLLVDSLTYFGEDLVFREPSKIIAVNKRDGRTYKFEAVSIGPVDTKYGKYHLIRCPEEGRVIDRRQAERYDIDRLGLIKINGGSDIRNALVYDISMRGIAFILDNDAKCKVGDHITASFKYDPNYFHFYACEATVVRIFRIENQLAIGCSLDTIGADIVTLISNKKKEKLGIKIDDILDTAYSPDDAIASGDKIPVNYVPQLAVTKKYEREKNAHRWELEEKPAADKARKDIALTQKTPSDKVPEVRKAKAEEYQKLPNPKMNEIPEGDIIEELQLLSPDDAADLIPERSEEDIQRARAERIADAQMLKELDSIEDRTPGKASGSSTGSGSTKSTSSKAAPAKANTGASAKPATKKSSKSDHDIPGSFPDNYDEYLEQNSLIDEDLFTTVRNDGFLTPDQIADIIELERIHRNE